MLKQNCVLLLVMIAMFPMVAFSGPGYISIQSRIFKPDGAALEAAAVDFRFSITDPIGTCVIYQEDFTAVNMTSTKGFVSLSLGGGSKIFPVSATTLTDVFNNFGSPSFTCLTGGSIVAGPTDRRPLVMQFRDASGWQTLPAININSVPFSMQAANAFSLGGHAANQYLRPSSITPCNILTEALSFNGASFVCVPIGGGGTGTLTTISSATADIAIVNPTTTPQLTLNVGTGANQIVKLTAGSELPAVSGAILTALNASSLSGGTIPDARMPALTGDVTMTGGTTSTSITAGAILDADINAAAGIARSKIAAEGGNGPGNVLINDGSGNVSSLQCSTNEVIKFNGSGVAICGTDSAGSGDVVNGGNTGAVTVGTTDLTNLTLETNNAARMTILAGGAVGIGTESPGATLDVKGSTSDNTATSFHVQDSSAATKFSILNDGSIGIGTAPLSNVLMNYSMSSTSPTASLFGHYLYMNSAPTAASTRSVYGAFINPNYNSSFATTGAIFGVLSRPQLSGPAGASAVYAGYFDSQNNATSTNVYGLYSRGYAMAGVTTNVFGVRSTAEKSNALTTNIYGTYTEAANNFGVLAPGTSYGLYSRIYQNTSFSATGTGYAGYFEVAAPTGTVTTGYGVYVGTIAATTKHSFYASDATAPSYFAGRVGVGTDSPEQSLDVRGTTSSEVFIEGTAAYVDSGANYVIPNSSLSIRRINLNDNATLTLPTFASTAARVVTITVFVRQDASGSRNLSWGVPGGHTLEWDGGVAPTVSPTMNKVTIYSFTKASDETIWYGSMVWRAD